MLTLKRERKCDPDSDPSRGRRGQAWGRRLWVPALLCPWGIGFGAEATVTGELIGACCDTTAGECYDLAAENERLYALTEEGTSSVLSIYDTRDPANLRRLGRYAAAYGNVPFPVQERFHLVRVVGDLAYVPTAWVVDDGRGPFAYSELRVLRVSDPTNIRQVGLFPLWEGVRWTDLEVAGNSAYVADGEDLLVLDVSDVTRIQTRGGFYTALALEDLQVTENRLYLFGRDSLAVSDLSDPPQVWPVVAMPLSGLAWGRQAVGTRVYTWGEGLFEILDASDPITVEYLGGVDTGGSVRGVHVEGHLAYVVRFGDRVEVLDAKDPAAIRSVGGFDAPDHGDKLHVVGNVAFVPTRHVGVRVFRMSGGPGFPPGFLLQPEDQSVRIGETATFQVRASGDEPLHYQWFMNGHALDNDTRIGGSRTSEMRLRETEGGDAGHYSVTVSNVAGAVESRAAVLTLQPDPARPTLAIRLSEGHVSLTLRSPAGRRWTVQHASDLTTPGGWCALATLTADASPVLIEDPQPSTGGRRFYRAVETP